MSIARVAAVGGHPTLYLFTRPYIYSALLRYCLTSRAGVCMKSVGALRQINPSSARYKVQKLEIQKFQSRNGFTLQWVKLQMREAVYKMQSTSAIHSVLYKDGSFLWSQYLFIILIMPSAKKNLTCHCQLSLISYPCIAVASQT